MTVVVAYRYATNPQDTSVGTDGVVDWSRVKSAVSEYDPVAIQLGRDLADAESIEFVGVIAGKSDVAGSMAEKNAISKGLDKGVTVTDNATAGRNATKVASTLAELVKPVERADILLAGDSLVDEGTRIVPALVAGFLGWPASQGVSAVARTVDRYGITQNVSGGSRTIAVSDPVVALASSDAIAPKIPPMENIPAIGKKPVEEVEAPSVDIEVTVVGRSKPERRTRENKIFEGADAPIQLVAALRADGML